MSRSRPSRRMQVRLLAVGSTLLLATAEPSASAAQHSKQVQGVSLSEVPQAIFSGRRSRDVLAAQVMLDRARFSPGVIDGLAGGNTSRAVRAYQRAHGLQADGKVSKALLDRLQQGHGGPAFQAYVLSEDDVDGPFLGGKPGGMVAQAELDRVAYADPVELLSEKFHMSPRLLRALNPDADFGRAGAGITVVSTGGDSLSGQVARIEVDRGASTVRAYAASGELLASYPATVGSAALPSPSGSTEVRAVAPDAAYYFDPSGRSWGPDRHLTIAPGPNNPVGGVWIDLAKEGYGIHGTPEPATISKSASHGCVRLTNWDARELAAAVQAGTKVEFL